MIDKRSDFEEQLDHAIYREVIKQASPRSPERDFLETWFDPRPVTDKIMMIIRENRSRSALPR